MPNFNYTALDTNGKKISGSYNATSISDVIEMLKSKKYIPVDIKEKKSKSVDIGFLDIFSKVNIKDLAVFCRQFQVMLNAGVTIVSSLDILQAQTDKKVFKTLIQDLFEKVQKGSTFSEALSSHKDVFPEIMISMIEAGEVSGNLDVIMERLSVHFEKEYKIENKVKSAMIYPIILVIAIVAVVSFLLVVVMPTFIGMFQGSGVPMPALTQFLIKISDFLRTRWYVLIALIVGFVFIYRRLMKEENNRIKRDKLKLKLPIIKDVQVKVASARFTRTMSTLMSSGVELMKSIEIVSRVTGNTYIATTLIEIKEDLRKGGTLSEPLKRYGIFPPMIPAMVSIGEESGAIDEVLDKTANFYDEEVDFAINRMTTMLEPIMIVIMAIIVGFVVIAMMLPMFDMVQTVS
ncbi:MAG: type II secretion system F family protein [Bacillota bacterium]|nr:type II secretion system F family protein [Bacillota bacterium]